jgi:oligopeptide/dipeptide ABC transporter ATP-binding protein
MRIPTTTLLIAGAALAATGALAAEELPRTQLKVLGLQSHLNSYQTGEVPFWSERISQASDGQVTARLTAQDMMGLKGTEVLRLMKLGVLDFASGVLSYMASDNAEFEAIDLPGVSQSIETTRAISDAYKPVLGQIMEEQYGVKLLMLFPSPPQVFWCKPEIAGHESLPGLKVRVFNKSMADMVTALGATSVTMPFGEVTPALERGVIDCAITGTLSGNSDGQRQRIVIARARAQPAAGRGRRGGLGARRLGPGPGRREPDAQAPAGAAADLSVRRPRPRRREAHLRSRGRDVRRKDRRDGADRGAAASLHCRAAGGSAGRRPARASGMTALQGEVPSPANPPSGCYFHPRCLYAVEICAREPPALEEIAPGRFVSCHRARELNLPGQGGPNRS